MTALPGDSSSQESAELRAVYSVAIKEASCVGLLLAISIVGALIYDWKSLKTKYNDGSGESNSDNELDQFAEL
ncbi:putative major facilitator superfamily transporter protein [Botrytis fragariae]|uniref:Putative major facilitator superfamily transporter protein n=1 Tax=Botrytis fragariae TaxID=1964551 RepID=A0A8H6EP34_9HELO|nr:putative major facilitator superfamily transporter protein [Botrytis fragariae]KAF5879362.1 putative major facilitator superfamily transporter protein [Botrytis fragariae]